MSKIEPLQIVENLKSVIVWMNSIIEAFENGLIDKKSASGLTRKTLRKLKLYKPNEKEKENYDKTIDLCTSLSTIERSEGSFEKYYLDSLKEEITALMKSLDGN